MKQKPLTYSAFSIVGIGGCEALQQVFYAAPSHNDLAFIVVMHLELSHAVLPPEFLQKQPLIESVQIIDNLPVEPKPIDVNPPNKSLTIIKNKLRLLELARPRFSHLPIDFFLRALIQHQGDQAIGIILSVTGSVDSLGLSEIKTVRGLPIKQAAIALFKVDTQGSQGLRRFKHSFQTFARHLLAAWNQKDWLSLERTSEELQGNALTVPIDWVVPTAEGRLNYSNVIIVAPQLI